MVGLRKKGLWLLAVVCLIGLAGAGLLWLGVRRGKENVDEPLRAIDAAHVIAAEENAATIYTRLVADSDLPSLDPSLLPQGVAPAALARPWRVAEFPAMAKWLGDRQRIVDLLREAGAKPQCWFSVVDARRQGGRRYQAACRWSSLLLWAANNDRAEGRAQAGVEKALCLFQMANHFLSQDNSWDYGVGETATVEAVKLLGSLAVTDNMTLEQIAKLAAVLPLAKDTWEEKAARLDLIADLYRRGRADSLVAGLAHTFLGSRPLAAQKAFYQMHLAECRAAHLLLALRRYKDQTHSWPASLAEVEPYVSGEALLDPLTGKPFVYRPSGAAFLLYGLGPNQIDDGGRPHADQVLWPR